MASAASSGRGPIAVLQIDRDRKARGLVEDAHVVDHLVERHVAVPAPEREREARARRRQGLEAEAREHLGRARVPGIGDDERPRPRAARGTPRPSPLRGRHDRDLERSSPRRREIGPGGRLPGMRQRVSLITLGVRDLARARRFYEALGWETGAEPEDDVVFFQAGDMVVALWDRARLAEDSCVEDAGGWGGVTLAHNVGSPRGGRRRHGGGTRRRSDDRPRARRDVLGRLQLSLHRSGGSPVGGRPQPALDDHTGRRRQAELSAAESSVSASAADLSGRWRSTRAKRSATPPG